MREIGTIDAAAAARFECYLFTLGISTRLEPVAEGARVWVCEEDHVARARQELEAFRANPQDERYSASIAQAVALRRDQEQADREFRKNFVRLRDRWDSVSPGRRPLTVVLIGLSVTAAVLTRLGADLDNPVLRALLFAPVEVHGGDGISWRGLSAIWAGQVWRLITPVFVHFDPLHLLFNMWWLLDLGSLIESRRGMWRLGALVILIAAFSNSAQYCWAHQPLFGGMSGVVYGLFGYVWMKSRYDGTSGFYLLPNTVTVMLVWLVLCMMNVVGHVANAAHVAGLAAGVTLGYAPIFWRKLRR
jgi:GlpG protein